MHLVVVALIGAGVLVTSTLSSTTPGSASGTHESSAAAESDGVSANFAQTTAQRLGLDSELQAAQPTSTPMDSLLLAVLSLESSRTTTELQESVQRILSLGVSQEPSLATSLTAVDPEEVDDEEKPKRTCRDAGSTAFCVYTVAEGDTLSAIARDLGFQGNADVSAPEMLAQSNKPDVVSSDHIEPGQNIRVPREPGILHTVLFAETAGEIAESYGVSLEAILASPYNSLAGTGTMAIGQEIFIPNPSRLPLHEDADVVFDEVDDTDALDALEEVTDPEPELEPDPTETPEDPTPTPEPQPTLGVVPPLGPLNTPTPEPTATPDPTETPAFDPTPETTPTPQAPSSGSHLFIWPTQGPISSYFGPSHPLGIDIDLFANPNADIVAARGGKVVFAGGDPCCSYGYYVIIDHGNGVQTLYAHLSAILVSEGDLVDQGDLIGFGGRTGYATGNHLHFEIRVNGNPVDPLRYLP